MASFSWWSSLLGLASVCTAAAYIFIFIYAIGLWDGQTWMNVRDFTFLLMSAAIAEFGFGSGIIMYKDAKARPGPFFIAASFRHMIIAVLLYYLNNRSWVNAGHFPSGFGDSPSGSSNATHDEVRETMRMTVIVSACVIDFFITLTGLASGSTLVVTKLGKDKVAPRYRPTSSA